MPFANLFRARKRRCSQPNAPKEGIKMKKSESPSAESPTYVTRDELYALTKVVGITLARVELARGRSGFADGNVGTQLEIAERSPTLPAAERAALKRIMKAFDAALDQHHAAERRRAAEAAPGARAFNF